MKISHSFRVAVNLDAAEHLKPQYGCLLLVSVI